MLNINAIERYLFLKKMFLNSSCEPYFRVLKEKEVIQDVTKSLNSNLGFYYPDQVDLVVTSIIGKHNNFENLIGFFLDYMILLTFNDFEFDRCDTLMLKWVTTPYFPRFIFNKNENMKELYNYVWTISAMYNDILNKETTQKMFLLTNANLDVIPNFIEQLEKVDSDKAAKFAFECKLNNYK